MTDDLDRRTFIRTTAAVSGAGLLAGCGGSGGDGSSGGDGGSGETEAAETEETTEAEAMDTESSGGMETAEAPDEVADYVGDSSNFDGSMVVMTDQDEVTVAVGAEGNGGAFAFDPPAVNVSTGTTVVWEWTGEGAGHNVKSEGDGPLDSGSAVAEEGTTYEYTFEETGTYLYNCVPHKALGMVGAVVVE
ncbi:halocyanin domain-containing protein [Haloarcula rubripromontorii]|uniref:Halocyanin n=1 Tax=Haloarcula rubripromontorii TaxID=1705562 RepID=A0A0N0BN88_9EURY|nr:halocyanin domain-containing protein [Haloarcula rubripromontorii]KOX92163.1 halocyanin [Haloarcula rubripromontorii]NLV06959.1 halocyanin domain-containing protein [Haloarcula rubripromontorii]